MTKSLIQSLWKELKKNTSEPRGEDKMLVENRTQFVKAC